MRRGLKTSSEHPTVLIDENIPQVVSEWLKTVRPSWSIFHVLDVHLGGHPDVDLMRWAQQHEAIIITYDSDFMAHTDLRHQDHYGIIRLRVTPTTIENTKDALTRLLSDCSDEALKGALINIMPNTIRIRPGRR